MDQAGCREYQNMSCMICAFYTHRTRDRASIGARATHALVKYAHSVYVAALELVSRSQTVSQATFESGPAWSNACDRIGRSADTFFARLLSFISFISILVCNCPRLFVLHYHNDGFPLRLFTLHPMKCLDNTTCPYYLSCKLGLPPPTYTRETHLNHCSFLCPRLK